MRLGASICLELARQGHSVIIHYRNHSKEAEEIKQHCLALGVEAATIYGDFTSLDDFIRRYKEQFPETVGLVNNVGGYRLGAPSSIGSDFSTLLQSNLTAPICLTNALLPALAVAGGSIVMLGVSGLHAPWLKAASYGITKSALWFYTRSLAKEVASLGVTVNMVSPGQLEISVDAPSPEQRVSGRLGTAEEVARLVAQLFAPESRMITGQNIEIAPY